MHSPLSETPAQKISDLPASFLLEHLSTYFHALAPANIVETEYSLWRCSETGLEFCQPPQPGNTEFYNWVSSFPSYYPGIRWEYGEVGRILKQDQLLRSDFRILDVGCGKGDFLRSLDLKAEKKTALDLNETAVQTCREQGFKTYCGTIESAISDGVLQPGEYPVVTSFHCLEHVSQPVEFVRELIRVTAPGGRVYVSTPASAMSFENTWFDVMNHPPHHMTRWNLTAYRKLAEILGVSMRHFVPPNSTLKQTLQTFRLKRYGANTRITLSTLLKDLVLHVELFASIWKELSERNRTHDLGGSDLILVEFGVP